MCGVTGYIASEKLSLSQMMMSLEHRGPDSVGQYETQINGQYVGVGHTRLSIIDLSEKGNQPFKSHDGRVQLIMNGEIYNYLDLKEKYLKTESFISNTDTEVVLKLYEKFGKSFVEYLNGDFAIAILDANTSELILIRDRAGVKPLYYLNENQFVFGSEIKSIIKSGYKPELNVEELQKYFLFKYSPGVTTLFKGIYRIPPASIAVYNISNNDFTITKYWEPNLLDKYEGIDYNEAQIELERLIQDAVQLRLMADVPVGTFLSGGIDSSIIASYLKGEDEISHYCASKSSKDIKKEGTTSDFHYAQRLANEWSIKLNQIEIGSEQLTIEDIRRTIQFGDDLIADGSQIPSFLITQEAAKHSKVILSGMGADEVFMGYAGHQLALLDGWLDKMPLSKSMANFFHNLNQGKGSFKAFRRYLHKLGKYHNYPNYKYGIYTVVGDFENSLSVYNGDKEKTIDFLSNYFPEDKDGFSCFPRFEYENFLQKNVSYLDRMTMANSVEGRVPFLDHRVMELGYSIPREFKISNKGVTKKILKDTYSSILPEYVTKRRKAGFGMPLRSIFSNQDKVNELLDWELLNAISGFDISFIKSTIQSHTSGKEDNSALIYSLISFQEWYKMYIH